MKPETNSLKLLSITRSKAKMHEYFVPTKEHIKIYKDPSTLFTLAIGILGELTAKINSNEQVEQEYLDKVKNDLSFSANFFDSYLQSKLNTEIDDYLLVLGSAAYYLSNLPGSSIVLINKVKLEASLGAGGLEELIIWLLKANYISPLVNINEGKYKDYLINISQYLHYYYNNGTGQDALFSELEKFRAEVYISGTVRELLFADIICATARIKYENSTWNSLPKYTDLPIELWTNTIRKNSFVKELWPSQHLLGKQGVLKGKSAVVQMPTSAGKTKSIEIIIRSAFLADRTNLVVIVAPFKALCQEIRNTLFEAFKGEKVNIDELSDVLQADFEIEKFLERRQILIVTPEKLLYTLRFDSRIADYLGLIIFDEGHQFDNGSRGVSYELLITSLKLFISSSAQTILISAVIRNAEDVSSWLNGSESEIIFGTNILPTYKSVAFTSWTDQSGKLEFVDPKKPENSEFYVPKIIEQFELNLKPKERKKKYIPERSDDKSIALYLSLKLVPNGNVALFCGRKDQIPNICTKATEAFQRGLTMNAPSYYSSIQELDKLHYLYSENLGINASATECAKLGILTHHGNTPTGLRLAVEHALQKGLARFVICTSTLAQGVNLPIRYLILSDISQGREPIKVRDFHNLIGRAGRAGMHTEGNIIFSNPKIFDTRKNKSERWRWSQAKDLLTIENSEPCTSTLLSIIKRINFEVNHEERHYTAEEILSFYIEDIKFLRSLPYLEKNVEKGKLVNQELDKGINEKISIINSIESYLMSYWSNEHIERQDEILEDLITSTLAYHLADEQQEESLRFFFNLINDSIQQKVPDNQKRKVFGRTLIGVDDSLYIENWLNTNVQILVECRNEEELLEVNWEIILRFIKNKSFKNLDDQELLEEIAKLWIEGDSFFNIFTRLNLDKIKISNKYCKIENIVDVCANGFGYDVSLLIGSMIEILDYIIEDDINNLIDRLSLLQKRMKYGLPNHASIIVYELGFSDRVIAQDISQNIENISENRVSSRIDAISSIKINKELFRETLEKYPSYFSSVLDEVSNIRT
jgi:POLQ-like helicase